MKKKYYAALLAVVVIAFTGRLLKEKGIYELRSVGALLPLSFDASSML